MDNNIQNNAYKPPKQIDNLDESHLPNNQSPYGLKGWLAFFGFVLIFGLVRSVFEVYQVHYVSAYANQDTWQLLTNPNSAQYIASFKMIFAAELALNAFLIVWHIYIIYLYFTKKERFKKQTVYFLIASVILPFLDSLVISYLINIELWSDDTIKLTSRSIISALIWVSYIKKSVRVKNTFVH